MHDHILEHGEKDPDCQQSYEQHVHAERIMET